MKKRLLPWVKPSFFIVILLLEMTVWTGTILFIIAVTSLGTAKTSVFVSWALFKMRTGAKASSSGIFTLVSLVMRMARTVRTIKRPKRF